MNRPRPAERTFAIPSKILRYESDFQCSYEPGIHSSCIRRRGLACLAVGISCGRAGAGGRVELVEGVLRVLV